MSLRANGSYIGPRPAGPTNGLAGVASGIWDLRTAQRQRAAGAWPTATLAAPTDLTGLLLWLDGSDGSSLYDATSGGSLVAAGGSIGRWQDKSGGSRHFTASGSAMPTLTASALNGLSVVTFDGNSDQLTNGTNIINKANFTIVCVVRRTGGVYGGFITSKSGDGSPGLVITGNKLDLAVQGNQNTLTANDFSGPSVVSAVVNQWNGSLYVGGSLIGTSSSTNDLQSTSTTAIGTYRLSAANFLAGYIAEMVVYDVALSAANRTSVEAYMTAKWGL